MTRNEIIKEIDFLKRKIRKLIMESVSTNDNVDATTKFKQMKELATRIDELRSRL